MFWNANHRKTPRNSNPKNSDWFNRINTMQTQRCTNTKESIALKMNPKDPFWRNSLLSYLFFSISSSSTSSFLFSFSITTNYIDDYWSVWCSSPLALTNARIRQKNRSKTERVKRKRSSTHLNYSLGKLFLLFLLLFLLLLLLILPLCLF